MGGASSTAGGNVRRQLDAVAVDSTISGIRRFLRSLGIHSGEYVTHRSRLFKAYNCWGETAAGHVLTDVPGGSAHRLPNRNLVVFTSNFRTEGSDVLDSPKGKIYQPAFVFIVSP